MLRAGPGDADRVAFLEGVVADEVRRDLPRDADDGDGVHEGVGKPGDRVGGAGAGGHEEDAALSRGPGITLGRVGRALLVADEDVADLILLKNLVINGQHGSTGVAEHMLDPLIGERAEHDLRTRHLF